MIVILKPYSVGIYRSVESISRIVKECKHRNEYIFYYFVVHAMTSLKIMIKRVMAKILRFAVDRFIVLPKQSYSILCIVGLFKLF